MTLTAIPTTPTAEAYAEAFLAQVAIPVQAVDTKSLDQLRRDYNAWCDERADLMSAERDGDIPAASEWRTNDDRAVKILDQLAAALGFNATPQG